MPDEHSEHVPIPDRVEAVGGESPCLLQARDGKAQARRTLHPGLSPWAAPGAIVGLANAAAAAAGASALGPKKAPASELVPLTVQLSVNLFREASRGTLTAAAETIYRGQRSLIVEVKVHDEQQSLVATLVVTQLVPRPAAPLARDAARLAS
jgi:acyl-coenzyme A thioesterase PaaI-like protein